MGPFLPIYICHLGNLPDYADGWPRLPRWYSALTSPLLLPDITGGGVHQTVRHPMTEQLARPQLHVNGGRRRPEQMDGRAIIFLSINKRKRRGSDLMEEEEGVCLVLVGNEIPAQG